MTTDDGGGGGDHDTDLDDPSTQRPTVAPPARERAAGDRLGRFALADDPADADGTLAATDGAGAARRLVLIDPRRDRMLREARALAQLRDDNAAAYELCEDGGRRALVAVPAAGVTLPAWLAERPRTWRALVAVFVAVGRGLAAAHRAGVAHRDVAARHVTVDTRGVPRLGGFRLTGQRAGAPTHAAPEYEPGEATGPLADQYALSAALWQALHGEPPPPPAKPVSPPGHDRTRAERPVARATPRPTPAADASARHARAVPPAIDALLRRGLAGDPDARFATMERFVDALDDAARPPRRTRVALAAAGALVVVAGVAAIAGGFHTDRDGRAAVGNAPPPAAPPRAVDHAAELARIAQLDDPAAVLRALGALPADALALPLAGELASDAAAAGPIRTITENGRVTALTIMPQSQLLVVGTTVDTVIHELDNSRPDQHVPIAAPSAITLSYLTNRAVLALVDDTLVVIDDDGTIHRQPACPGGGHVLLRTLDLHVVACSITLPDGRAAQAVVELGTGRPSVVLTAPEILAFDSSGRVAVRDDDTHLRVITRDDFRVVSHHRAIPPHALVALDMSGAAIAAGHTLTWWDETDDDDPSWTADFDHLDWLGMQYGVDPYVVWAARSTGDVELVAVPSRFGGVWHAGGPILQIETPFDPPGVTVVRTADQIQELWPEAGLVSATATPELRGATRMAVSSSGAFVATARDDRVSIWMPQLALPHATTLKRLVGVRPVLAGDATDFAVPFADHVTVGTLEIDATTSVGRGADHVAYAPDHTLAAVAPDGTVWTWRDDVTRTLGTVDDARSVVGVSQDRALVIDDAGRVHAVHDGRAELACGGRRVDRVAGDTAIVAGDGEPLPGGSGSSAASAGSGSSSDDTGSAAFTSPARALCNIARGVIRPLPAADRYAISPDGSRVAAIAGGEVIVLAAADLATLAFPRVRDVTDASFDTTGKHLLATSPDHLAIASEGGTEPVALASSAGVTIAAVSADGTRVAARTGDDIVAWDVERPTRRRPVGRIAHQLGIRAGDLVVTPTTVALAHLDIVGWHTVTTWQIGPTPPATIRSYLRYVRP
jgi:hypothetical protein|nr:hypothetical protein [Kofleriaceae bacterium]